MLLYIKSVFLICSCLLVFFPFISCSDKKPDNQEKKDSYAGPRSDLDILQLGIEYHENPGSKPIAYEYLDRLIKEGCYTQAVFLMDDLARQISPDATFWDLYFKASLGGHHFDKLEKIPGREYKDLNKNRILFDAADSIEKYNGILRQDNKNEIAYRARAEAFYKLRDWHAAEYDYLKAWEINSFSFNTFYSMLYIKYLKEDYSGATSAIIQNEGLILRFSAEEQEIIKTMKLTFSMLSGIENENNLLPKERHFKKARILSKANAGEIALIEVNKAIELDNNYGDAYALRSFIYYSMEKLELALQDIKYAENLTGKEKTTLHKMIIEKMNAGK